MELSEVRVTLDRRARVSQPDVVARRGSRIHCPGVYHCTQRFLRARTRTPTVGHTPPRGAFDGPTRTAGTHVHAAAPAPTARSPRARPNDALTAKTRRDTRTRVQSSPITTCTQQSPSRGVIISACQSRAPMIPNCTRAAAVQATSARAARISLSAQPPSSAGRTPKPRVVDYTTSQRGEL